MMDYYLYKSNYEKERALMEGALVNAMDDFFNARPYFEKNHRNNDFNAKKLFEDGFIRGWHEKKNQLKEEK